MFWYWHNVETHRLITHTITQQQTPHMITCSSVCKFETYSRGCMTSYSPILKNNNMIWQGSNFFKKRFFKTWSRKFKFQISQLNYFSQYLPIKTRLDWLYRPYKRFKSFNVTLEQTAITVNVKVYSSQLGSWYSLFKCVKMEGLTKFHRLDAN